MKYEIAYGPHFVNAWKRYSSDTHLWQQVHRVLVMLSEDQPAPSMNRMRIGNQRDRHLFKVYINDHDRMLYEGPLRLEFQGQQKPCLWIHEVGRHDEINRMVQRALDRSPDESDLCESPLSVSSPICDTPPALANRQSWWLPWTAFVEYESFERLQDSLPTAIRLSPKQQSALSQPYPLLIQGQAGSGKTVLLYHHIATRLEEDERIAQSRRRLYLSYSDRLVDRARKDVEHILTHLFATEFPAEYVEFLSHEQLLRRHINNVEKLFPPMSRISWPEFRTLFWPQRNADLAWHAIRSFFKGACLPGQKPPLGRDYFQKLSEKQRPFELRYFDELFQLAQQYQRWLERYGYWDDLDLARMALESLQKSPEINHIYNEIYCDEGQDLTLLDYEVLIRLSNLHEDHDVSRPGLIVAADPFQTIHPSGFRWSSIKDRIYTGVMRVCQKGLPIHVTPLSENFRCAREIVALANTLLQLRGQYSDESIPEQTPTGISLGLPQLAMVENLHPEFQNLLQQPAIKTTIIVLDGDKKEQLKNMGIPEDRLYTVFEAKGLEFDSVIVWRLFDGDDELWGLLNSHNYTVAETNRIRLVYYLNTIYVAVTRTMKNLFILERSEGVQRWRKFFGELVEQIDARDLEQSPSLRQEFTEKEWQSWAQQLFDREDYARAIPAYERAKDRSGEKKSRAHVARLEGRYADSGRYFQESGDNLKALEMFYQAGKWMEVINLSQFVGTRGSRLRARAWYEYCEQSGLRDDALRYLSENIKNGLEDDPKWLLRAAQRHEELKQFEEAAPLYDRVGEYEKAGDCYCQTQRWNEAVAEFAKGGVRTVGRHRAEGEVAFGESDFERATEAFRKAQEWERVLEAANRGGLKLIYLEALKRLKRFQEALSTAEELLHSAIHESEKKRFQRERLEILIALERWQHARIAAEELEDYEIAIDCCKKEGTDEIALDSLRINLYRKQQKWRDAAYLARKCGYDRDAIEYDANALKNDGKTMEAAGLFIRIGFLYSAIRCLSTKISTETTKIETDTARTFFMLLAEQAEDRINRLGSQDKDILEKVLETLGSDAAKLFKNWPLEARAWMRSSARELAERYHLREDNPATSIRVWLASDQPLNSHDRYQLREELRGVGEYLEQILTPHEIAKAWELSRSYRDAALAYLSLADELDHGSERLSHLEASLRMRIAQRDWHIEHNESEKLPPINRTISRLEHEIEEEKATLE